MPKDLKSILKQILAYFEKERFFGAPCYLKNPRLRLEKATGLSRRAIQRLLNESEEKKVKPNKNLKRHQLDNFDICVIRSVIHNRYLRNETVSLDVLAQDLRDRDFPTVSKIHLKNCIERLGFRFFKSATGRRFAKEREDLVAKRMEYLRRVQDARESGDIIVYVNDTCINGNHCGQSEWCDNVTSESSKLLTGDKSACCGRCIPSENRLIVLDAGCKGVGLIPDVGEMFMVKNKPADYLSNNEHFFDWWKNTLLPALPAPSTIVIGNAPYHSMLTDRSRLPTVGTLKDDIILWLIDNGLEFKYDMRKSELLDIVNRNKPHPVCIVDELALQAGHSVLRLPPRHCELNPIELVWAEMKGHVSKNNSELKIANALFLEAREKITLEFWEKCEDHVINKVEHESLQADIKQVENTVPVVIDMGDDSNLDDDDGGSEPTEDPSRSMERESVEVCEVCMGTEPPNHVQKRFGKRNKDVAWISCDGCKGWFHVVCEKVKDVNADVWFCAACSNRPEDLIATTMIE